MLLCTKQKEFCNIDRNSPIYAEYIKILNAELICVMGCTEPIVIAYASAVAKKHLGCLAERCLIEVSGTIIKCSHTQYRRP